MQCVYVQPGGCLLRSPGDRFLQFANVQPMGCHGSGNENVHPWMKNKVSLLLGGKRQTHRVYDQRADRRITYSERSLCIRYKGARGVMVIVVENGHGDTSSNPGRD